MVNLMLKPTLFSFLMVAAGAMVVGAWLGRVSSVQAQDRRIFELRAYTALPGRLEALNARFRNHTTKLFEKHGMTNVGYWIPTDAPRSENTLIYILAHKSREAAEASWKAFRVDPDWKNAQAESEKDGKIVEKVESVFLRATPYSGIQ